MKLKSLSWNTVNGWIVCGGENGLLKVLKLDSGRTADVYWYDVRPCMNHDTQHGSHGGLTCLSTCLEYTPSPDGHVLEYQDGRRGRWWRRRRRRRRRRALLKYVKKLLDIKACAENYVCTVLAARAEDDQFILVLCNAIGSPSVENGGVS